MAQYECRHTDLHGLNLTAGASQAGASMIDCSCGKRRCGVKKSMVTSPELEVRGRSRAAGDGIMGYDSTDGRTRLIGRGWGMFRGGTFDMLGKTRLRGLPPASRSLFGSAAACLVS